jgi:hypothetical protein
VDADANRLTVRVPLRVAASNGDAMSRLAERQQDTAGALQIADRAGRRARLPR